jgi:putative oxidoreductase
MGDMPMKLLLEERRSVLDVAGTWLPRIVVSLLFIFVGKSKFVDHGEWVAIFAKIGFGQWFRYFTGVLQVLGGVLVLIPKTFLFGILLIECTMVGAMAAWIFFLGQPFTAIIPGALLIGILFVGGEELSDLVSTARQRFS